MPVPRLAAALVLAAGAGCALEPDTLLPPAR